MVNEKIEEKMDLVRDIISLGRNAREEAKIKVRQPISKVILDKKSEKTIGDLQSLILEELNVKKIEFTDNLSDYMTFSIKPNFKVCGPIFGSNMGKFTATLNTLSQDEIIKLENNEALKLKVDDKDYDVNKEMVDIRITSKEGFNASNEKSNFIILDTTLTESLINEGIARELISKVQQLRKNKDFNIVDRINIYYEENEKLEKVIEEFMDTIKNETLAIEITKKDNDGEVLDLNGINVKVDVQKIG